ncbi:MAG: NAD(P)H-dependent oxidoreductase [Candidatus Omnitrophica bacterium]|nr:NAD(P)H-dependent oxidoreductase [Candidatus Omnitrophota bacterium]
MAVAEQAGVVTPGELVQQLRWRYATKKFDPARKIPADRWDALEQALVLSPSSFGLQPWKFIVVTDPAVRERLRPASWNQPQITDASHVVVFAHRKDVSVADVERYVRHIAAVRGIPEESLEGYKQMMAGFVSRAGQGLDINAWAARQLYIALGTFLTSAALLGIDACPMEGIDPKQYDEILGLDAEGYRTVVVATAGYRAEDDAYATLAKVRYASTEVVAHR